MAKPKKTALNKTREKYNFLGVAGRNMTYKDIKRKAIILGMPFPDATGTSIFSLLKFINQTLNKPDKTLIDQYDEWMDKQLSDQGIPKDDPLRSSRLRLGFLGEEDELGNRKSKRIPGIKKPREKKPPREKDLFGLLKGTKKSYTWELTARGYSKERIERRMLKKFPEASPKSIQLWSRNCKRWMKKNGNPYEKSKEEESPEN